MGNLPRANKTLGQHFLRDQSVINSITENYADVCDAIIEVGPGPGILTKNLSQLEKPLLVIEKDQRFPELLADWLPEENIILDDALEIDLEKLLVERGWQDKKIWLISNLPYNISAPLTLKFTKIENIKWMTLMYQREVADKIFSIDTRKGKAMNSLMGLCQSYFDVSLLLKVPPGAFSPPPKVDSAVLSFSRKEEPLVSLSEFDAFESYLRTLFQFKRKQVAKVLKSRYSPEKIQQALDAVGLERSARAESFNLEQVQLLYSSISS